MQVIKETLVNYEQMAIMEKYETLVAYLYPIAQSLPRKHGIARDMFLRCLFGQAELFYEAGKTNQVGKLYVADAGLAHLRFWLRFLVNPSTRGISTNQHKVALSMLSEIGSMLGSWIIRRKG